MNLRLLTYEETAALFHKAPDSWRKIWPKWKKDCGFPAPVAGPPYLWDETAIRLWLVERAPEVLREKLAEAHGIAPRKGDSGGDVIDWQRHLDERYGT